MNREQRHEREEKFADEVAMETFVSAQAFAMKGLEHADNSEYFNTGLAFGGAYRVTAINHAPMGVVTYISEMVGGQETTYAIPPVHQGFESIDGMLEGMIDSKLFPEMFPGIASKKLEFISSLRAAKGEKLLVLNGIMRYLAQHG